MGTGLSALPGREHSWLVAPAAATWNPPLCSAWGLPEVCLANDLKAGTPAQAHSWETRDSSGGRVRLEGSPLALPSFHRTARQFHSSIQPTCPFSPSPGSDLVPVWRLSKPTLAPSPCPHTGVPLHQSPSTSYLGVAFQRIQTNTVSQSAFLLPQLHFHSPFTEQPGAVTLKLNSSPWPVRDLALSSHGSHLCADSAAATQVSWRFLDALGAVCLPLHLSLSLECTCPRLHISWSHSSYGSVTLYPLILL